MLTFPAVSMHTRLELVDEIFGSSAPWWGTPLIAGIFLILGAVLAFVFNSIQDSRKARREKQQRWDQNVLAHASEVITLLKKFRSAASDARTSEAVFTQLAVDQMKRGEAIDPPPFDHPAMSALMSAYDDLTRECDLLRLVAPQRVRDAVEEVWVQAGGVLLDTAEEDLDRAVALNSAESGLATSVRTYFGIERERRHRAPRQ